MRSQAAAYTLLHQQPSRLLRRGYGAVGHNNQTPQLQAGADSGLYAHPNDPEHGDILHRNQSLHHATGLYRTDRPRETGSAPVLFLVRPGPAPTTHSRAQTHRPSGPDTFAVQSDPQMIKNVPEPIMDSGTLSVWSGYVTLQNGLDRQ